MMRVRVLVPTLSLCFALLYQPMVSMQSSRADGHIDTPPIQRTVDALGALIDREYFDPAVASRLTALLHERLASGAYADGTEPADLARRLTADMYPVAHDKHLAVNLVRPAPASETNSAAPRLSREEAVRRSNGGVRRVEILEGNVGYLNLTSFWRPNEARQRIDTAMRLLAGADALILDMRDNTGGSPDTVALVASYLLDAPHLPLFDIAPRYGKTLRYCTSNVQPRNGSRPVYVLTSARTFSGGEGLAFLLQERGRAVVVGEVTAGAANPGRPYPVNDLFEVVIPNGRVISVVSGRNWEGAGVTPDIPVLADDALTVAHQRALERFAQGSGGFRRR